jgi:hypothetical protein
VEITDRPYAAATDSAGLGHEVPEERSDSDSRRELNRMLLASKGLRHSECDGEL